MFRKITLQNGLKIITIPQKNTQAVTVLVLVGTGSKYETKDTNGISHFLEHMYFKGTKKRPTSLSIATTLDKIGGIYNAFTGEEYTGYFAKVAATHLDLALDWVSDIFLNSALPEKEIEKEKGVIMEEINMIYDHPIEYVQTLWSKLLYGDQPAGWDIAGTKESVMNLNRAKLMNYMKKQYVASNTIIAIAGRIRESEIPSKIKKYFSKITATQSREKLKVIDASVNSASILSNNRRIERQNKPNLLLHPRQTDQTHLCIGARAFNLSHPRRYVQDLLAIILGGMMSSRLFIEVRAKLGIAYYINTKNEANPDTGSLFTQVGLDNKNVEKGISTILREYKKISRTKVSQKELKKAKDYIKGKTTLLLESSDTQASFYGGQELLEKKILTLKEIFAEIDKVKPGEILKLSKEIFRPEKLNLALIGPVKEKTKLEKLLNDSLVK